MAAASNDRTALLVGELSSGRETAQRLRHMLRHDSDQLPAHQGLVSKILDSLSRSISILDETKIQDSKSPKEKRGCYKRRRSSETWVKESPTLVDDGYAWRKYGQKAILNAKHPRNYFRCTHKFDQGCQASKQVQKIQDNPPLYQTTYHNQHTCKYVFPHHIIVDEAAQDFPIIWTFQHPEAAHHVVKQEEDQNIIIPNDPAYLASPELMPLDTHSMGMDIYDFDDFLDF